MNIKSLINGRDEESRPFIVIFTNTFPYGTGETFFETELPYLLSIKRPLLIVPLYREGNARKIDSSSEASITISPPLLDFNPKKKSKLFFYGLLNTAPLFFAFYHFFAQQIWRSRKRIWRFGTSFLLIRALLAKTRFFFKHPIIQNERTILYFYWGDKSVLLLPFVTLKAKTVVRFHGSDLYEEAYGFHPLRQQVLPLIDLACPVSQHGADYLKHHYDALCPPISVARLGTVDHGLSPEPNADKPFHIVSCANIIPLKRIDLIMDALLLLFRNDRFLCPVCWTHIGKGTLLHPFEKILQDSECTQKLTIRFCGPMLHKEVMAFYTKTPVDLFISTSRSEGVPVSIMEALSFGIPVMATAVGGVPELVSNDVGCLLPASPTPEEVAQRLVNFMEQAPSERNVKRKAARTAWETGWNADVNFREWANLLSICV